MKSFYNERREKYYKSFTQVSDLSQYIDNVIYFTFIAEKEIKNKARGVFF